MCRSIQQLRGAEPPASEDEIRDAARQYVRKVSGYREPSAANREVFEQAVDRIAAETQALLDGLVVGPGSRAPELVQRRRRPGAAPRRSAAVVDG
jgi:hypothetical protein